MPSSLRLTISDLNLIILLSSSSSSSSSYHILSLRFSVCYHSYSTLHPPHLFLEAYHAAILLPYSSLHSPLFPLSHRPPSHF